MDKLMSTSANSKLNSQLWKQLMSRSKTYKPRLSNVPDFSRFRMMQWDKFGPRDIKLLRSFNRFNYYGVDTENYLNGGLAFILLASLNGFVYILQESGNMSKCLIDFLSGENVWIGVGVKRDFFNLKIETTGRFIDSSNAVFKLNSESNLSGIGYQCFLMYDFDYKPMSNKKYFKRYNCSKPKNLFGRKYPSYPPTLYAWDFSKYRHEIINYLMSDARIPLLFMAIVGLKIADNEGIKIHTMKEAIDMCENA